MAYEMERQAPNVGQMIVDIQLIRRAASEDPDLEPYKEMIEAAKKRLADMNALRLVNALVAHSRLTRKRFKI
jgi:hypothetical protein